MNLTLFKLKQITNDLDRHNQKIDDVINKFIYSPDKLTLNDLLDLRL